MDILPIDKDRNAVVVLGQVADDGVLMYTETYFWRPDSGYWVVHYHNGTISTDRDWQETVNNLKTYHNDPGMPWYILDVFVAEG